MLDAKLLTFLEVARLGSYTRAAERLHLTQPAVTQHIRKLEEHYRRKLMDTSGRAVRLTAAGEEVLSYARLQLNNERRLMERLSEGQRPLCVGATLSIADYYLPPRLSRYLSGGGTPPHVEVGNTETLLSRMHNGDLDCALIEGLFDEAVFEADIWLNASFVPIARAGHPLACGIRTLRELCGYPLLLREPGSGTRAVLENALFQRGMSPDSFLKSAELGGFGLIKAVLAATDAVSFMYEGVCRAEIEAGTLCELPVADFSLVRPLYFLRLRGGPEGERCNAFYEAVRV